MDSAVTPAPKGMGATRGDATARGESTALGDLAENGQPRSEILQSPHGHICHMAMEASPGPKAIRCYDIN